MTLSKSKNVFKKVKSYQSELKELTRKMSRENELSKFKTVSKPKKEERNSEEAIQEVESVMVLEGDISYDQNTVVLGNSFIPEDYNSFERAAQNLEQNQVNNTFVKTKYKTEMNTKKSDRVYELFFENMETRKSMHEKTQLDQARRTPKKSDVFLKINFNNDFLLKQQPEQGVQLNQSLNLFHSNRVIGVKTDSIVNLYKSNRLTELYPKIQVGYDPSNRNQSLGNVKPTKFADQIRNPSQPAEKTTRLAEILKNSHRNTSYIELMKQDDMKKHNVDIPFQNVYKKRTSTNESFSSNFILNQPKNHLNSMSDARNFRDSTSNVYQNQDKFSQTGHLQQQMNSQPERLQKIHAKLEEIYIKNNKKPNSDLNGSQISYRSKRKMGLNSKINESNEGSFQSIRISYQSDRLIEMTGKLNTLGRSAEQKQFDQSITNRGVSGIGREKTSEYLQVSLRQISAKAHKLENQTESNLKNSIILSQFGQIKQKTNKSKFL